MSLINRWNGKVSPKRNWFQRALDRLLGRKWVLVATYEYHDAPSMRWYEMRRPQ